MLATNRFRGPNNSKFVLSKYSRSKYTAWSFVWNRFLYRKITSTIISNLTYKITIIIIPAIPNQIGTKNCLLLTFTLHKLTRHIYFFECELYLRLSKAFPIIANLVRCFHANHRDIDWRLSSLSSYRPFEIRTTPLITTLGRHSCDLTFFNYYICRNNILYEYFR